MEFCIRISILRIFYFSLDLRRNAGTDVSSLIRYAHKWLLSDLAVSTLGIVETSLRLAVPAFLHNMIARHYNLDLNTSFTSA